jgi:DNA-binding TFAR19-related protein (PDSD5 family)
LDEGLEAARKKKLESLEREKEGRKKEEQVKELLRRTLEEAAYARLMNVKLANAQLYGMAANQVFGLYQKAGRKITEAELVSLLKAIKGKERETKITFK